MAGKVINLKKVVREPITIKIGDKTFKIPFIPNSVFLPMFGIVKDMQEHGATYENLIELHELVAKLLSRSGNIVDVDWVADNLDFNMILDLFTELMAVGESLKEGAVKKDS